VVPPDEGEPELPLPEGVVLLPELEPDGMELPELEPLPEPEAPMPEAAGLDGLAAPELDEPEVPEPDVLEPALLDPEVPMPELLVLLPGLVAVPPLLGELDEP